ncbi:Prolyl tripeptidyl peptidase precursor [Planctopirus ephydatiae]|uniref:Prolyl tripeptidyl peptidase n=1 Tax=Planctopirus ephydatiae TaxID=2528019 RepID=A0A518GJ47_9PLAN|nr:DPP IV N-terminal domain-containing protein [Planctopirus ephydatiae]QDV28609.1 Prolyl tripeptidyl peptidase precursor [Planctopirus ephydatiae]
MSHSDVFIRLSLRTLLCGAISVYLLVFTHELTAQVTDAPDWQSQAETRLKAIYDRGEFRAKNYRPTWLPDSSGFIIEEFDPQTKKATRFFYEATSGQKRAWPADEKIPAPESERLSPAGTHRLVVRDRKLLSVSQANQQEILLATPAPDRFVAYRNPVWSPDGSRVLFIEADFTDVRQRSVIVPGDPSYPGVEKHRFARVGGSIEQLRVGVVNADGQQLVWLPIEIPSEGIYLGQVEWAGNSQEILVEKFSRFRDQREFLLATTTGQIKTIFSESNEAWVESSQGKNSGLVWIQEGQAFVVITEKDGWRHAYRCSRDGNEVTLLTSGNYDIIDRAVIDEKRGWYYFYASPDDATQKYLYRVPLDGSGQLQRITPPDQIGTHSYQFSPDATWAIHTFSTLDSPPSHELIEVEGHRVVNSLESHDDLRERMKLIGSRPAEFLKLDIGKGLVFDAWMLKPKDFDPSKKYPLFIYVYGEPHSQTVLNEWGAAQIDFHRVVADHGYVVVSIDNRGTPAPKGAAWRRAVFGCLGLLSTEEQEAGLKALAKGHPFIDTSRVGIWGWSGGGSNTLNALFRKPDSYHVGIAVVPKPQPHLYNAWFQEIFMRTREVNPDGYQKAAAINYADGLKGKLLIITGSGETNTHIQIIEGLVDRLIALGKPFDYMVYPYRDHGLREGDGTQVHVRMLILRYLMQNLPAGPQPATHQ